MPNPKRNLRGMPSLGGAIDERVESQRADLDLRHDTGQATAAPLSGSGGGSTPALPESYVTSLMKSGEGTSLSGDLELAASGDVTLAQAASAPHFTVGSPSYTASDGVARSGDNFTSDSTVIRTSGAQTIGGVKSFSDKLCLDEHQEQAEISAPGTPDSGWGVTYNKSDGRRYHKDDGGNEHDLTCQAKHIVSGAILSGCDTGGTGTRAVRLHSGASMISAIIATPAGAAYDWANQQVDEGYGSWVWESTRLDSGSLHIQSDITLWHVLRKFGDGSDRDANCRVVVKCRIWLSGSTHFESVKLILSDLSADNASAVAGADIKASASGAWYEATLSASGTDVGSWANDLACGVECIAADLGDTDSWTTEVRIRWISAELWAN